MDGCTVRFNILFSTFAHVANFTYIKVAFENDKSLLLSEDKPKLCNLGVFSTPVSFLKN